MLGTMIKSSLDSFDRNPTKERTFRFIIYIRLSGDTRSNGMHGVLDIVGIDAKLGGMTKDRTCDDPKVWIFKGE